MMIFFNKRYTLRRSQLCVCQQPDGSAATLLKTVSVVGSEKNVLFDVRPQAEEIHREEAGSWLALDRQ